MAILKKKLHIILIFALGFSCTFACGSEKRDELYISPNSYKAGSQSQRIQKAINDARKTTGKVVIPKYDEIEKTSVWLLDQAILLPADFELELNNCKIKLSDKCRDNFIRSANSGLGIKNIVPLKNIKISGRGNVLLEGADNPRSTGDHNKVLSANPKGYGASYGSDAGKPDQNHRGGWRNHAIILAYVDAFEISGIKLKDYHGHGIVMERCTNGIVKDITFEVSQTVHVGGSERQVLNQDGLGVRFGCKNIMISNCRGRTGDDFINIGLTDTGIDAGTENVNVVSGSVYKGEQDDIANIFLQNWQDFYSISHRAIRIMPAGKLRISHVFIENMLMSPLSRQGFVAEYPQHIQGLVVKNLITYHQLQAKGISNATFRDILYIGDGTPIDVVPGETVFLENVRKMIK